MKIPKENSDSANLCLKKESPDFNNTRLWEFFLRESQKRTLIFIIYGITLSVLAIIFKTPWLILIGTLVLWAGVFAWSIWKNKTKV
jgi:uncharacterized RDD family membrane protein YckC